RLRENTWNGNTNIELELIGVRLANQPQILFPLRRTSTTIPFEYKQRHYTCGVFSTDNSVELRIKNTEGRVLAIESGNITGLLGNSRKDATPVDLFQPHYYNLVQAAIQALEMTKT
ncbi:MAG: single-stranded-DNA-specific exonuclease RecJ, partial [Chroococcidiopsis sp.]